MHALGSYVSYRQYPAYQGHIKDLHRAIYNGLYSGSYSFDMFDSRFFMFVQSAALEPAHVYSSKAYAVFDTTASLKLTTCTSDSLQSPEGSMQTRRIYWAIYRLVNKQMNTYIYIYIHNRICIATPHAAKPRHYPVGPGVRRFKILLTPWYALRSTAEPLLQYASKQHVKAHSVRIHMR